MTNSSSVDFACEMTRLGAAYRKPLSDATIEVYFDVLGTLAPLDLEASVSWAIRTSRYLPTPAELLDRAKYERTQRFRALPPAAPAGELPEWVTEGQDVKAMLADLQGKLSVAETVVMAQQPGVRTWRGDVPASVGDPVAEAHLPHPRGTAADMEWRAQKAVTMLREYRAWCEKEGLA